MGLFCPSKSKQRFNYLVGSREGLEGPSLNATGKASFPRCSRTSDVNYGPWFGRPRGRVDDLGIVINFDRVAKNRAAFLLNGKGKAWFPLSSRINDTVFGH